MRRWIALIIFAAIGCLLNACIERVPDQTMQRESPVTAELRALVDEDNALRPNALSDPVALARLGERQREAIYRLLAAGLISQADDLYRSARLLIGAASAEHTDALTLAEYLAREAITEGADTAGILVARAVDRRAIFARLPQPYGTQFFTDADGVRLRYPIDTSISDSERVALGLDSLSALAAQVPVALSFPPSEQVRQ